MARIPLDVATGFYESSSSRLAAQECLNMYPRVVETQGALNPSALFATSGINEIATAPVVGNYRGSIIYSVGSGDQIFAVFGTNLYQIDFAFTFTNLGTISGLSDVRMAFNGETIAIQVSGGNGYFYDAVNGLQLITDAIYLSYGSVRDVVTKDGYFIFLTANEVFLSDPVTTNGGRGFPALSFFTSEIKPDFNSRAIVLNNELWIFGAETAEVFQNTGVADRLYQRLGGAAVQRGLFGSGNIVIHLGRIFFVGQSQGQGYAIYRLEGSVAVKVSTQAIDEIINSVISFSDLVNGFGFSFQENGSFFVGFTFGDSTFIYDSTASALIGRPIWHERGSDSSSWRPRGFITRSGTTYALDDSAVIAELNANEGQEYGADITRRFSGQYLSNQSASLIINEIEVRTQTNNLTLDDETIKLEVSYDGAETWINLGDVSIGTSSNPNLRQIWRRIGQSNYQVVFRVTTNNTDATNILQMFAEAEGNTKWL